MEYAHTHTHTHTHRAIEIDSHNGPRRRSDAATSTDIHTIRATIIYEINARMKGSI